MNTLFGLAATHPAWVWIGAAAVLLAAEAATGSGYLLWAAASAALVGAALGLGLHLGVALQAVSFAAATAALTFAAQPWLQRRRAAHAPDRLNQPARRLVGREGVAVALGRVAIEGQEWAAEYQGPPPAVGGRVRVIEVLGGATLRVTVV